MYRSMDGTCNNLQKPMLGAAFRPYIRHFPSQYDDGIEEPVSSIIISRPTAREANRVMLSSPQSVVHDKYNNMMMQWGQFISHDLAKTTLQASASCISCVPVKSRCMPIPISPKDPNPIFKLRKCLRVSRSSPVCGLTPREQLNENTAYIDGSMVYGSSLMDLHKFRDGRTGMLKTTRFNNQLVLPFDQSKCPNKDKCSASFTAGDIRANLFLGLSSLHIIFAREHNRIARRLQDLNRSWSGDRLFQETRKIVGAIIQNIVYNEYLPKLLGVAHSKVIGEYKGYDNSIDPTIANEFTTSAFRFGHGMLEEGYKRLDFSGQNISHGGFTFSEGVFKSSKILFEGGVDPVLRGLMNSAVKRPHRMTPSITEKMFGNNDLGTLNIQRGRDHGIPSYNTMRTFCGLPKARNFEEFSDMILDRNLRIGLSRTYNTTNDVDFYVGSMLEDPVIGGLIGTTLSCVIGEQFKRLRDGDRFYFENPGVFTPLQLNEIRKSSLSRVICDNGDQFELISQDAFLLPGPQLSPCNQLPRVDLTKWRE
ncbi:Peroxidase mlt-7 [Parelaphostrongylus tenuis]|uniref:peroxidase n=1 Tax=Parelaphostrongylus tenuis TaxID=148309 RepID=A0AAD5QE72_PARTN|nr:Peroxidase mlt-7 [Parelaphostrongylus tenuis]